MKKRRPSYVGKTRRNPAGASRPKERARLSCAGFTLMEVMVAVVILGLAYVAILQNFSLSLRNIDKIRAKLERTLEDAQAFDQLIMEMESGEEGDAGGEVYMEGNRFWKLVLLTSEDGNLSTLVLAGK